MPSTIRYIAVVPGEYFPGVLGIVSRNGVAELWEELQAIDRLENVVKERLMANLLCHFDEIR